MEGMLDKGKNVKGLQRKIADACKKAGLEHHIEGKENNIMYTLGKKVSPIQWFSTFSCLRIVVISHFKSFVFR